MIEQRRAEVVEGKDQTARPGSIRGCIGCHESGGTHDHCAAFGLAEDMCRLYGDSLGMLGLAVLATISVTEPAPLQFI